MSYCGKCGGEGWAMVEHGEVATYEACPACGPIFESIALGVDALRIGCAVSNDYTMNILFNRSEALFDDAVNQIDAARAGAAA